MVVRCEIEKKKCLIVDFDNTLIMGNSTILLTRYLAKKLLYRKEWKKLLFLFNIILKRKLREISHSELKFNIAKLIQENLSASDLDTFTREISSIVNTTLVETISEMVDEQTKIIIATGALELLFPYFKKYFNSFDFHLLATQQSDNQKEFIDNRGLEKYKKVKDFMTRENLNCNAVFSDHEEDIPIFHLSIGKHYLVNPQKRTLEILKNEFSHSEFIKNPGNIYSFN